MGWCEPKRGSSASWHCDSPVTVRLGAVAVFLVGCAATTHFVRIFTYDGFNELARLIDLDTGQQQPDGDVNVFGSVRVMLVFCILIGFATMFTGALGYVANEMEGKGQICTFFVLSTTLAVMYVGLFLQCMTLETVVEPVVVRQAAEFCNATLHMTYRSALQCEQPRVAMAAPRHRHVPSLQRAALSTAVPECGQDCQLRVATLREINGCRLLDELCHDFDYSDIGSGFCEVYDGLGGKVVSPTIQSDPSKRVIEKCCEAACDSDIACAGYTHRLLDDACFLVARRAPSSAGARLVAKSIQVKKPRHLLGRQLNETHETVTNTSTSANLSASAGAVTAEPVKEAEQDSLVCHEVAWTPNVTTWPAQVPLVIVGSTGLDNDEPGPQTAGVRCSAKWRPHLVDEAVAASWSTALMSIVSVGILLSSTVCSCFLQYTLTTYRAGRKGAGALLGKMLCPCCAKRDKAMQKKLTRGYKLHAASSAEEDEEASTSSGNEH